MDKQYYWDLLEQTGKIEQEQFAHNIPTQTETINLKCFAFAGLLRQGELFQIESNKEEIERIKEENQKKIISSSNTQLPDLMENIKFRNMDGTVYTLELAALKAHLKNEFDALIYKQQSEPVIAYEEVNMDLPDFDMLNDDNDIELEQIPDEQSAHAEVQKQASHPKKMRDDNYLPALTGDMRYNHDPEMFKTLDSFCLDHVRLVYDENGQKAIVDFNIFPLKFVEDAPIVDIMVVALSGSIIRAGISRGASAAVRIDFDELAFMVRGKWEGGKFITQVNCLDNNFAEKFKQQHTVYMPTERTYTTYMQEERERKIYSFFPASIAQNNHRGNAPCAMVFNDGADLKVILSNESDSFNMLDNEGLPYKLQFYWSGGQNPKFQMTVIDE